MIDMTVFRMNKKENAEPMNIVHKDSNEPLTDKELAEAVYRHLNPVMKYFSEQLDRDDLSLEQIDKMESLLQDIYMCNDYMDLLTKDLYV